MVCHNLSHYFQVPGDTVYWYPAIYKDFLEISADLGVNNLNLIGLLRGVQGKGRGLPSHPKG